MNIIRYIEKGYIIAEPLTVAELKLWMKITFTDDDVLIGELISSAREYLEQYTGLSLAQREITIVCDLEDDFTLPYGPAQSITSVSKRWSSSWVDADIDIDYEKIENIFRPYFAGMYKIVYVGGYSDLPFALEQDIKRLVSYGYQNRGINFSNENTSSVDFPKLNADLYRTNVI